ncbi:MAG: hypothetical protein ABJC26_05225 [Gemmatimonadaceae bacterium]
MRQRPSHNSSFELLIGALLLIFLQRGALNAQQPSIPIRQVHIVASSDSATLAGISSVRQVPDGGVIVNDSFARRLLLFDSALKNFTIIADSANGAKNAYKARSGGGALIAFSADSSLFIDVESQTFLVIDPKGSIVHAMASAKTSDLLNIANARYGQAFIDPKGRLVYGSFRKPLRAVPDTMSAAGTPVISTLPDSTPILRMDFDRRTVDTISMIKTSIQKIASITVGNRTASVPFMNPLPVVDDWTSLPDGTIAIIRSADYHIDWLTPEGQWQSTPKMPFAWRAISDDAKISIIDSVRKVLSTFTPVEAFKAAPGEPQFPKLEFRPVDVGDLPSHYPPLRLGQTKADLNGNVWILPNTTNSTGAGLVYDVVNRAGKIVERVHLPLGRRLVGFGPANVIYLYSVLPQNRAVLERAQIVR